VEDAAVLMRGIHKQFMAVLANHGVDFEARAGEIHGLLGENGAGKTTLMRILSGFYQPDAGNIYLRGRLVRIATKWRIVKAHTYDDSGFPTYNATTDASGKFSVVGGIPPGQNYLITWWDPVRKTFVTTFLSDSVPVNIITVNPLEPAHTTVATS